jgi:hypothetical protein
MLHAKLATSNMLSYNKKELKKIFASWISDAVEYSIKRKHMCEQRRLNLSIIFLNDAAGERNVGTVEHITFTQKDIFIKLLVILIYALTPNKPYLKIFR